MAAVTVTSYRSNVAGSYRNPFYQINIATSGDTLAVPLRTVRAVSVNDTAVSKVAVSSAGSGSTLTFTTTGALTGVLLDVLGQ